MVVGLLTVFIDFICYQTLVRLLELDADTAKGFGFLAGTAFAYLANRYLTFSASRPLPGSIIRFSALYAFTLIVNIGINAAGLSLIPATIAWKTQFAFLGATSVSATLNFLGMKLFVFKPDVIQ